MGNTLSTQLLSRHSSCSAVASAVSTAITITPELEAARRLFALTPVHHNNLREALSLSSSCSTASMSCASTVSPLLLQARHSYSNFLIQDESLKLALPHSLLFSSGTTAASLLTSNTSGSSSSYISQTIFSILQKIREKANQLSSLLVSVASLVLQNPRLVLAGSVSIMAVAGSVYYLVIKQNVIGSLNSTSSIPDDHSDNNDDSFSELEKKLIKQKIQAQSDLGGGDSPNSFCPFENEKHNRHMSLCCPITTELFEDPVFVTSTGHTFERSAITQWILMANTDDADEGGNGNGNGAAAVCPLTRIPIKLEDLVPNKALKQAVMEYCTSKQQQT